MHDLVIRNARICDGLGNPIREGAVGVKDGRIAAVGPDVGQGRETVDAQGLTLAVQLGSFPDSMRILMADHAATARPGDVFLYNDPYGSGGQHLPDVRGPVVDGNHAAHEAWLVSGHAVGASRFRSLLRLGSGRNSSRLCVAVTRERLVA